MGGGHSREIGVFFFSSRRRHTRCSRDWSSDVCSSDLFEGGATRILILLNREENNFGGRVGPEYAFGRFHSVKNGHRDVEHDNIRKQLSSGANSRFPVHYHANDFATVAR